jgi:solute carrier family 9 (sodium/hydrogen exchanger), member 6/7
MKHYAYYNMSRRTQLTTKWTFQLMAQLSENFIFIYLGLTLFTDTDLVFKPLFILITFLAICVSRYLAVFPLSKAVNWTIRFRARRRGKEVPDELPHSHQVMLFWAGLRGAVGVALAATLQGSKDNIAALQMTVLVVVVLTVITFGGTTARMLEILGIRTGVVEEVDSDDEFDIETAANGTYYKRGGTAFGHTPTRNDFTVPLGKVDSRSNGNAAAWEGSYSSGSSSRNSPPSGPGVQRSNSASQRDRESANAALIAPQGEEDLYSDSDLPPAAPRRSPKRRPSPPPATPSYQAPGPSNPNNAGESHLTATEAIRDLFTTDDPAQWFKRLDEAVIKPSLLLDQGSKGGASSGPPGV